RRRAVEASACLRRRHPRVYPDAPGDARHRGAGAPGPDAHRGRRARELPSPAAVLRRRQALRDGAADHGRWEPSGTRYDPARRPATPGDGQMSTGSPLQLGPTRRPVVRLNRRVIYVVGAGLIGAVLTGLIAIRAQGSRASEGSAQRRTALQPGPQPWYERIPDQEPAARPAALDPLPSRETPPSSVRPVTARLSTEEPEEAQQRRALRAAMSAPIGVPAFERGPADHTARRRAGREAVATPAGMVIPADRAQAQGTSSSASGSDAPGSPRGDTKPKSLPPEYLRASVREPVSPFEVKAGTIIPAVMLGAINSDLPGQIRGQVRENVYDSDTGEHLLIPQGTRLVGLYDHKIVYGQERVLITWKRLILPNGSSLS